MAKAQPKPKKKKRRSTEEMHRQVQDSLQVLPKYIEMQRQEGKRVKAFALRYLTGPMLRVMKRVLDARRYRGTEGQKLRQTEQMRRHLEQRQAAIKHVQTTMQKAQKAQRKGRPK